LIIFFDIAASLLHIISLRSSPYFPCFFFFAFADFFAIHRLSDISSSFD